MEDSLKENIEKAFREKFEFLKKGMISGEIHQVFIIENGELVGLDWTVKNAKYKTDDDVRFEN